MGADKLQTIPATKVDWGNHNLAIANQEKSKSSNKIYISRKKT